MSYGLSIPTRNRLREVFRAAASDWTLDEKPVTWFALRAARAFCLVYGKDTIRLDGNGDVVVNPDALPAAARRRLRAPDRLEIRRFAVALNGSRPNVGAPIDWYTAELALDLAVAAAALDPVSDAHELSQVGA